MRPKDQALQIDWAEIESSAYSRGAEASRAAGHDVDVFRSRSVDHSYRQSEAFVLAGEQTNQLQEIRTHIARGLADEAHRDLATAFQDHPQLRLHPEYQLEVARLHAFQNNWMKSIEAVSLLLTLAPTAVTKMTALQCRSIAHYELGQWPQALRDVEQIRSLGLLYPLAPAPFYAEITKIKVELAQGQIQSSLRKIEELWSREIEKKRLNADRLLTLLRAEAVISRTQGLVPLRSLSAAHLLAVKMGDDLYAALSRLEMFASGLSSSQLLSHLKNDEIGHARIRSLLDELRSGEPASTTARTLNQRLKAHECVSPDLSEDYEAIFVPSKLLMVRLEPFGVTVFPRASQSTQALRFILSRGSCTKAELFGALFDNQKYVSHLHDSVIHQVISRIRQRLGVKVSRDSGLISVLGVLLGEDSE